MKPTGNLSSPRVTIRLGGEMAAFRLAAILEHSCDAIFGTDINGFVFDWNKSAERIFGHAAGEIMGTSFIRLTPEDRRDEDEFLARQISDGGYIEHFETIREAKDGRRIEVSLTVFPIRNEAGEIAGASHIVRDITVPKEHEREVARLNRLYAALSQVNQAIARSSTRAGLFEKVCEILVGPGGFHMASIGWHNPDTHEIVAQAVAGDDSGYLRGVTIYGDERPQGLGPTGQAFRSGRPYICNEILSDPATFPWRHELAARGLHALAVFPIWVSHEVWGTLNIYSDETHFFRDKEIALLSEAAGDVSQALETLAEKEARQAVEQIARDERIFSATMIESMPGILYFYDEHGNFLRWNRTFETVSGYSGQEIAGMHPLDFFADSEKDALKQRIAEVFAKGESFVEASFATKQGRSIPYFFTGRRVMFNGAPCLVGMGVDISERKQAEMELRETQGQLEAVVENLREGLVIADPAGELLRWNEASLRMLGFTDLAEGRRRQRDFTNVFDLYTLDGHRLPHREWPLARVRRGEPMEDLEIRVCRLGSDWERIFSYSGLLVPYAGNKTLAFMTLRDITARKRAEMALRVLNQTLELEVSARTSDLQAALVRAEAADRLKSAFLATMSHELRTPLNSIIGFTGIVLQGWAGPLNAEQSKQLGMVRSSARHLLELINDVLDLSKIEAGQMDIRAEPFDVRESLERVVALIQPLAEKKGLTLAIVAPPDLGQMNSDRRRLEQLLLNLVNNGVKFTEHGGVTITAEIGPSPASASVSTTVVLRVADTGMGIKPEHLPLLFQPFRQIDYGTTRQHEGTGLGLAICRRIAALLGGDIQVTSEWGKGSDFIVTLPRSHPSTKHEEHHSAN